MKKISNKKIQIKLPKNLYKNIFFSKYLHKKNLKTICKKLSCPNIYKCFNKKKAAFMILGTICTRKCPFCNIKKGKPKKKKKYKRIKKNNKNNNIYEIKIYNYNISNKR